LAGLLAPFVPFVTEMMYQRLVRAFDPGAAESIHLTDFPVSDPNKIDERLSADMDVVLEAVTTGHAARQEAAIKGRQPLPALLVYARDPELAGAVLGLQEQILDELNVKEIKRLHDPSRYVSYGIRPNLRALGPR